MKLRHVALALSFLVCSGLVLTTYAQKSGGLLSALKSAKQGNQISGAQLIRARANWFYRQRAFPLQNIPAAAQERARSEFLQTQEQQRQYFQQKYGADFRKQMAAMAVTAAVPNVAAPWTAIGPQPTNDYFFQPVVSGRVSALLVDPCDSTGNTVFLGGAQGGVWKTTDGGQHWVTIGDQTTMPSLAIGSLASSSACVGSSPATSATIYVGTGEQHFSYDSYYGAGVLACTTTNGAAYSCTRPAAQKFGSYTIGSAPISSDYSGPFIGGLAVDPQNSSILLAAVQGSGSTLPSGAYCSADGGTTWMRVVPAGANIFYTVSTAVAFDQAGYGYAAIGMLDGGSKESQTTANGIYKSGSAFTTDCSPGASFSALSGLASAAGGPSAMGRIAFSVYSGSSASNDEIFAAIANASDVSSTLNGVYGSTDGGATWSQSTSIDFCGSQCFYDLAITIDPHNANVIYAGGSAPPFAQSGQTTNPGPSATIIASINGGSTWSDVANNYSGVTGVHVDAHAIAFKADGSSVYAGTDGGVWSSASPESPSSVGFAWNNLNATLGLTQIYPGMSTNPSGWQYRSFLGTQDNGMQVLGPDLPNPSGAHLPPATPPWAWNNTLACGDSGVTLVDPLIPSTVYGECSYIPGYLLGIEKSIFNGNVDDSPSATFSSATFHGATNGIDDTDDGNFIPPLAIDPEATSGTSPADAQTLYFGTYRVWQTINGGAFWDYMDHNAPDVTGYANVPYCTENSNANIANCVLTALAVAPKDSNEVVTGSSVGQIYVSTDAMQGSGSTWTNVTGTLPGRYVTHVAVDPASSNTLYATFSGFSGFGSDHAGHVFLGTLTTTGTPAVAWSDISAGSGCTAPAGDLPNIPVNSIVVDPDHAGTLYVGTDVGVYMGTLQGTAPHYSGCWQPLGTGLPNSAVLSLTLNEASRTLIAGTHGRSAWEYSLGDLPAFALTGLSPTSTNAGGSQFTLTLGGTGFSGGSSLNWLVNGTAPANCVSNIAITNQTANQLTATVPAACIAAGGVADVSVTDSSNTTNSLAFTITALTPTVTNISPTTGTSGNPVNLTLVGTNFLSGSTTVGLATGVSALPCSPLAQASGGSATQLTTTLPGSCLQSNGVSFGGIYFVTANNPQPGGGSSNPSLIAAPLPYGGGCSSSNPEPGCLLVVTGTEPSNDSYSNATSITANSYSKTEDTSSAANGSEPAIPSTCTTTASVNGNGDFKSVWFKYTPTANTTAEMDTIGSNYDTILSVWTASSSSSSVAPLPTPPLTRPVLYGLAVLFLVTLAAVGILGRRRPVPWRAAASLGFVLLLGTLVFQAACGGGTSTSPVIIPPTTSFSSVACNDDISGNSRLSQISNLSLNANTTYYILVSDWGLPVYDSSGSLSTILAGGGKMVLNFNAQ